VVIETLRGREIGEEELVGELEYHINKYIMALLVYYYWFYCVLDSGSRPLVPQLSKGLGRLVRRPVTTPLTPLLKPTLVLSLI
jgi:hypothetical protein